MPPRQTLIMVTFEFEIVGIIYMAGYAGKAHWGAEKRGADNPNRIPALTLGKPVLQVRSLGQLIFPLDNRNLRVLFVELLGKFRF